MRSFISSIFVVVYCIPLLLPSQFVTGERDLRSAQDLKWPGGIVPYKLSPELSWEEELVILQAMESISSQTCVTFVPSTYEVDFLLIKVLHGKSVCRSTLGYTTGMQLMQLGVTKNKNCVEHGTVLHYLMKVLGFHAEHRRPDRDEYVEIHWDNMIRGKWFTFQILGKHDFIFDLEKEPYDYFSLMHPDANKFAKDSMLPVISPNYVNQSEIGQRVGLSEGDVSKIRDAYNCKPERYI